MYPPFSQGAQDPADVGQDNVTRARRERRRRMRQVAAAFRRARPRHFYPPASWAGRAHFEHTPETSGQNRPRTHHRIGMRRGQNGGQKAPIRGQFRPKTQKKSKKAPNSALPILTFRPSNPLGTSARPGSPSKIARIGPNSTQKRPPTYRRCAMCVRAERLGQAARSHLRRRKEFHVPGRGEAGQSETPAPANSTKASQAMFCHLASRPMAFSSG